MSGERPTLVDRVVDAYLDALDRIWFDTRNALVRPVEYVVKYVTTRVSAKRRR